MTNSARITIQALLARVMPVCLLSGMVIVLGFLSVRPDWHVAFHALEGRMVSAADTSNHCHDHDDDSNASDHDEGCAIELFAAGLVDAADSRVDFGLPFDFISDLSPLVVEWRSTYLGLSPPGRAPPVYLS